MVGQSLLTGWRMGWSVWPEKLIPHVTKLAINASLCQCPFTICRNSSTRWANDPIHHMMKKFDQRRKLIHKGLNDLPGKM